MIDETNAEFPNGSMPNMPLSIPGIYLKTGVDITADLGVKPEFSQSNPLGETILTNQIPLVDVAKDIQQKPGWWETAAHSFYEMNREMQAYSFIKGALTSDNPLEDEVPDGWTAMNPEAVEGFPVNYWDRLTSAKSPKDLAARQEKIRHEMEEDEYYSKGSFIARLAGGIGGFAASPSTWYMPFLANMKYASLSQNVLLNMGRVAPGIALDSVSRNLLIQANREGGNLDDLVVDSLSDSIFNTALMGVGGAFGYGLQKASLYQSRKTLNMLSKGLTVDVATDAKGVVTGFPVRPMQGTNLSAAEVDFAQAFVNESMAETGLLKIPGVKKLVTNDIPGLRFLQSPLMKAANSPYQSTKYFVNRLAPNTFMTKNEAAGIAVPDSAWDYASKYQGWAKQLSGFWKEKYHEANGIEGGEVGRALKNLKQTITNGKRITEDDFDIQIRSVLNTQGYRSEWSQANEVADKIMEVMDTMNKDASAAMGRDWIYADPRNAWKYFPQAHNIAKIKNDREAWIQTTANALKAQYEQKELLLKPVNRAKQNVAQLKEEIKQAKADKVDNKIIKILKDSLDFERAQLSGHKKELIDKLKDNPEYHILLEDRVMLDSQETEQLKGILKPLHDAERQESALKKAIENANKSEQKRLEAQLKAKQEEILSLKKDINEAAHRGEIDQKFFRWDGWEAKFHDVNAKPKFREHYATDEERMLKSSQWFETITQNTPQDIMLSVFGDMNKGMGLPTSLKERTILVPNEIYNENGWLAPITETMTSYMQSVGKIIGFKKAFPEFAQGNTFDSFLKGIKQEHDLRLAKLREQPTSKKRAKEIAKAEDEKNSDLRLMSDMYKAYFGQYAAGMDPKLRQLSAIMRNNIAAVKLGAVPIYQIAELGSIVLKNGLMPFLSQGLRPMLLSIFKQMEGREKEAIMENAAHAYVAVNRIESGIAQKFFNADAMGAPPVSTGFDKATVATQNMSHMSGNLFGINWAADMNEMYAANAFQSEVMRAMFAFKEGTLKPQQKSKMARYGIDVEKYADRFINEYKKAEGWSVPGGGHYSMYYKWGDLDASNRMAMSIRRAVHDTVVNGNIFTNPMWANNPILSMVFMFHSWSFGAFARYAVPIMQRPDAEHILGVVSLVGLSMLADPLLRMANGKSPFDDEETWFNSATKGLEYSGLLGPTWETLADLNTAMGNAFFPKLQLERQKNRSPMGKFLGPIAGYINDAVNVASHAVKGDFTEGDAKRLFRMVPFVNHIGLRWAANSYMESLGLPQTRATAEPWSFRETIYGE